MALSFKDENTFINKNIKNKKDAINFVGQKMVEQGYVKESYIDSMFKRDELVSVSIGGFLAIPHSEDVNSIIKEGILFVHVKNHFLWDNLKVKIIICLALKSNNQIEFLSKLGNLFNDMQNISSILKKKISKQNVYKLFNEKEIEWKK